jgi:hypothetical protein
LYRPKDEFAQHPTNLFERGILADGAGNCISMGRADKHTDLMAKAMCLGSPVPAYALFRITIGWRDGEDGAGGCPGPQPTDRPHRSGGPHASTKSLIPQVVHHEIMSYFSKIHEISSSR